MKIQYLCSLIAEEEAVCDEKWRSNKRILEGFQNQYASLVRLVTSKLLSLDTLGVRFDQSAMLFDNEDLMEAEREEVIWKQVQSVLGRDRSMTGLKKLHLYQHRIKGTTETGH